MKVILEVSVGKISYKSQLFNEDYRTIERCSGTWTIRTVYYSYHRTMLQDLQKLTPGREWRAVAAFLLNPKLLTPHQWHFVRPLTTRVAYSI